MVTSEKIRKLLLRIYMLVETLKHHEHDFGMHQQIDQFYYMEREDQLNLWLDQLEAPGVYEQAFIDYKEVYWRWRKDVRWLHRYLLRKAMMRGRSETTIL